MIVAEDPSTWDKPSVMDPPAAPEAPAAPRPGVSRRRAAPTEVPAVPTPTEPTPAALRSGLIARVQSVASHPATSYIPAEVGLATAESDIPDTDLGKALTYMARQTELPLEMFFAPYTDPKGTQGYISREGVILSADDARRLVGEATPDILARMLPAMVDQYNEIPTVATARRKYRQPKAKLAAVADVLNGMYEGLGDRLQGIGLESLIGTAIQVGSRLRTPAERAAFAANLKLFGSQDAGHWSLWVMAAEQAAASGTTYQNPVQAIAESGMSRLDQAKLQELTLRSSAATYGVRTWNDPNGDRHAYLWDPIGVQWTEIPAGTLGIDLPGRSAPRAPRPGVEMSIPANEGLNITEMSTPPSSWGDITPNTPTSDGGTFVEPALSSDNVLAAGFLPLGGFDLSRTGDYWRQSQAIAAEMAKRQQAWETSYLKVGVDATLKALNTGFQWAQGLVFDAFTALSNVPFGLYALGEELTPGGGGGFERLGDYNRTMFGYGSDILRGRETLGTTFASTYHLPDWVGVIGVDLPSAFVLDPLIMGGRAYRSLESFYRFDEAILGSRSFLGRQLMGLARERGSSLYRLGEFLNRPPGGIIADEGSALWNLGRRIDEAVGLPISGMYSSRSEQLRAFVEMQLRDPKRYLGNRTFAEFLTDKALEGENLYDSANIYMRGYYHREAFSPELTTTIEGLVRTMKQSGEFDRADMVDLVDRVLLAGFGLKPMHLTELESLLYRPAILGGSGAKVLRGGFADRTELVDALLREPVLPNVVGDARHANAYDIFARQQSSHVLTPQRVEALTEFDTTMYRSIIDEAEYRLAGFRPMQLEFPHYSRVNRFKNFYRGTDFAASRTGRAVDALLFNRVPEAMVGFEEGRYVDNFGRRLVRARMFTPEERAAWLDRARAAANTLNPQREREMVKLLEQLNRATFDRIAESFNLDPESARTLFDSMMADVDKLNRENAKRAYGVTLERNTAGEITTTLENNAVTEAQLLNSYYIPDPLAIRRSVRDAVGVQERVANLIRALKPDVAIAPLPDELLASTERSVFQRQLEDALTRANWQPSTRDWAMRVWDELAMSAVTHRPDLYPTVNDFFHTAGVRYAEEIDTPTALFKRAIEVDPVVAQWAEDMRGLLAAGTGEEQWYEASRQTIEALGPRYLWGKTTLRDGSEISDIDLFTQILAVMSPQRAVSQNLDDALTLFFAVKGGEPFGRTLERIQAAALGELRAGETAIRTTITEAGTVRRLDMENSIEPMIDDILSGSKQVRDLPLPVQQRLMKGDIVQVPAEDLLPYTEFPGRTVVGPGGEMSGRTVEQVTDLRASAARRGYDIGLNEGAGRVGPITLEYNPSTGEALVREGHHRIGLFAEQGKDVQVRVVLVDHPLAPSVGANIQEVQASPAMRALSELGGAGAPPVQANIVTPALAERLTGFKPTDVVRTTMDNWDLLYAGEQIAPSARMRQKVTSFWRNLTGDLGRVTVDTWMYRAFGFPNAQGANYQRIVNLVEDIAAELDIPAAQVQAGIWYLYKSRYADKLGDFAGQMRLAAAQIDAGSHREAQYILDRLTADTDARYLFEDGVPELTSVDLNDAAKTFERRETIARDARAFSDLLELDPNIEKLQGINNLNRRIVLKEFASLAQQHGDRVLGMFVPGTDLGGVVAFFRDANPSTLVHEAGHFFRQILSPEELRSVTEWLAEVDPMFRGYVGSASASPFTSVSMATRRRAEELFADALETYFRTDVAPPSVQGTFARIRDWLARVWRDIRGNARATDPRLAPIFDNWLSPDRIGSAWAGGAPVQLTEEAVLKAIRKSADWLARDVYLKLWKPAQVLRLGYILRVPALDEQIRFMTDLGLWTRMRSQGFVGSLLTRAAERGVIPKGYVEEEYLIRALDGSEHPVTRVIPGALPDEVYANSNTQLTQLFPSMLDEVRSIEKGALRGYYGSVPPTAKEYAGAWDTAVNGHLSATSTGRRVLYGIATDQTPEQVTEDLVRWATEDPIGRRVYSRIGRPADEVDEWAKTVTDIGFRYTMGDPNIALDAMRRRANATQLDELMSRLTEKASNAMASREGASRTLTALEEPSIEQTARKLRAYIKANGGATFDPVTGEFVESGGYVVGMTEKTALEVPNAEAALDNQEAFLKVLREYRDKVGPTLSSYDNSYLGAWMDGDGTLHLDPAEIHQDFESALGAGALRNQEAIWSLDKGREYTVFNKPTVHGQVLEHALGEDVSPAQVFVNTMSKYILQLPTNRLSRQPFFKAWYDRVMELQTEMLKSSGWAPRTAMDAEQTISIMQANARGFALDRLNRVMFNFRDQNRLSELMSFVVPFAQPWFEAWSVYGHLIRRNPALIGWARLAFKTAVDAGAIRKDPNTGEWMVPTSNLLGMAPLMSAISGFSGFALNTPLASFNLFFNNAFPVNTGSFGGVINIPVPSMSPPVTWLLQQMADSESTSLYASWLFQYGRIGVDGFLPLPTWLQYAATAFGPEWLRTAMGTNDAYKSYVDEFLRLQQYLGIEYPNGDAAVASAERDAKTFFRYRALMGFTFPGSVRVSFPQQWLEDEWRTYVDKYGAEARDKFLAKYPDQWLIVQAKTLWEKPDPNLPENVWRGMPAIPATPEADAILQADGFREFANRFPAMAWALVIGISGTGTPDYSPDILMKQMAAGDRRYREPADFYESGQAAAGWNAYWQLREWWEAKQEYMKLTANVSETDPEWKYNKGLYDQQVAEIRKLYPGFSNEFGISQEEMMDPRTMKYARTIAKDKVFSDLPIGKALVEYLKLHDEVRAEMSQQGIPSIDSTAAVDTGLAARYETGVNDIIARTPEFQRLYLTMFEGAALTRVTPEIDKAVAALPEDERARVFDWQRRWNDTEKQLDVAIDDRTKVPIYQQQADLLAEAYDSFPAGVNPVQYWFQSQPWGDRQETIQRAELKNPMYMTRFDRDLLGISTDSTTEQVWRTIMNTRSDIFERDLTDPNYSVSAGFDILNGWIAQQAAANPVFAQQLQLANTWGGAFFAHDGFVTQTGPAGDAWRALKQTVANYQTGIEQAGLHGTSSDEELYTKYRRDFLAYVDGLRQNNVAFREQWDALESASSADLAESFYPTVWFRLGA